MGCVDSALVAHVPMIHPWITSPAHPVMSDLIHACSVLIAGFVVAGFGIVMSWHCCRSLKRGAVQVSPGLILEQRLQPVGFRFMILFFGLCAIVLLGAGFCCITEAARLF